MEELFQLTPLVVGAIPVVVGLVQVLKSAGLPSRLAPAGALLVGAALVAITGATWQASVVQGIIVGLCASGLYSGVKTTDAMLTAGTAK